jgi:hypothetical protein
MAARININPHENNGIVRLPQSDWETLYEVGLPYNLSVQEVFEILIVSGGINSPLNKNSAALKVKMAEQQRTLQTRIDRIIKKR